MIMTWKRTIHISSYNHGDDLHLEREFPNRIFMNYFRDKNKYVLSFKEKKIKELANVTLDDVSIFKIEE